MGKKVKSVWTRHRWEEMEAMGGSTKNGMDWKKWERLPEFPVSASFSRNSQKWEEVGGEVPINETKFSPHVYGISIDN